LGVKLPEGFRWERLQRDHPYRLFVSYQQLEAMMKDE
jgi:hypothetical protein